MQDEWELGEGHEWESLGEVEVKGVGAVEEGDGVEDVLVEEAEGSESRCLVEEGVEREANEGGDGAVETK